MGILENPRHKNCLGRERGEMLVPWKVIIHPCKPSMMAGAIFQGVSLFPFPLYHKKMTEKHNFGTIFLIGFCSKFGRLAPMASSRVQVRDLKKPKT